MIYLTGLAENFADALTAADAKQPVAINQRTNKHFQPGIGPHSEAQALRLAVAEMQAAQLEACPVGGCVIAGRDYVRLLLKKADSEPDKPDYLFLKTRALASDSYIVPCAMCAVKQRG